VLLADPSEVRWHALRKGRLVAQELCPDALYRSEVFLDLWLDPEALLAGDLRRLCEVLDRGIATPEHETFVARLGATFQPGS